MSYMIIPSDLDFVNKNAKVVIVGISPGRNQMNTEIKGLSPEEAKKTRSFAGSIRNNLVEMLDYIGINKYLGIDSCMTLWGEDYEQNADFTSVLKGCVMDTKKNTFISSIPLPMKNYPEIEEEFNKGFARDCSDYSDVLIWVALGDTVETILKELQDSGKIKAESIILNIPHPSGVNAGKIKAFLGQNDKEGTSYNNAREKAIKCKEKMKRLSDSQVIQSVDDAVQSLKESPLFALSLSGKELAHSNMWAWLIEACETEGKHPFVEVFIEDFYKEGYEYLKVEREKNNRDLSIWYKANGEKKCAVVENKIKSLPKNEQLEEYERKLGKKFGKGILTGIEKTIEPRKPWKFLSYEKIAESIESTNKKNNFPEKAIIQQYVEDLQNIITIVTKGDERPDEYTYVAPKEIEDLRFGDVFLKHKACKIQKKMQDRIDNQKGLESKWGSPEVDVSFNNKKATITIIYREKDKGKDSSDKDKEYGRLGVQLEGKQFRVYGGPSFGNSLKKEPEECYEYLKKFAFFEDYDPAAETRTIRGKNTGMTKPYCQYRTSNYTHLYQWWTIKDGTSIESLCDMVIEELLKAKECIDNKELSFTFR